MTTNMDVVGWTIMAVVLIGVVAGLMSLGLAYVVWLGEEAWKVEHVGFWLWLSDESYRNPRS